MALWPFLSSHRVVRDRLKVRVGDTVLITGASGGMGQALQLARLAGARVIATTRHGGKAATLRDLGADEVVCTADADRARAEVLATTGDGVDHAVDYTGNPELLRWLVGVIRLGGTLVVTF